MTRFVMRLITANKIYQRVQPLGENPLIGRMVPEFNRKDIRELIRSLKIRQFDNFSFDFFIFVERKMT